MSRRDKMIKFDTAALAEFIPEPTEQITPNYFVEHYREILPMYISSGKPANDTTTTYFQAIDDFIKWCINMKIHPLSVRDYQFRIYIKFLNNNKYSQATVQLKIAAIRAFFSTAQKLELIKNSPCVDIKVHAIDLDDSKFKFITVEQFREVCDKIMQEPMKIIRFRNLSIFMLMAVEGLRCVEIHRLNDEDINFDMKTIYVRGKGHNDIIYPCADTLKCIMQYLEERPTSKREGLFTPTFVSDSNFNRGVRISREGIRLNVNHILTISGLKEKGFSCHMLRHSCGTNLYEMTKDLRLVQETLRHQNPKVTARYAHIYNRLNNRQTEKISPFNTPDSRLKNNLL